MHAPEHASPACTCECPPCEAAGPHAAALPRHAESIAQAVAAERDPITPQLEGELLDIRLMSEAEWRALWGDR